MSEVWNLVPALNSSLSYRSQDSWSSSYPTRFHSPNTIFPTPSTPNLAHKIRFHSKAKFCDIQEQEGFPHVQTLSKFPKEELYGKVVMVRLTFSFPVSEVPNYNEIDIDRYLLTIKHLYNAGAKVIIASSWGRFKDTMLLPSTQNAADYLSSLLQLKVMPTNSISDCTQSRMEDFDKADILLIDNLSNFKEEMANCSVFARKLSTGVDIFVNDSFFLSHKILASIVGVPCYCYASIAGFGFEEELRQIMEITRTTKKPYIAIIGGDNINDKAAAILLLASKCDGLVFVGMMAFQIMHAKGLPVPLSYIDIGAVKISTKIVEYARKRSISIHLPCDFWCAKDNHPYQLRNFPASGILDGWKPVDIGPSSMSQISSLLSKCKKILWIGPLKFVLPRADSNGASELAVMLEASSRSGCDVIVVGSAASKEFSRPSVCTLYENARVLWEFLKGRVLPGLAALDRAYPFEIDWDTVFDDPSQPLVVDIGSGNGLFLFGMARRRKDLNFLGLEMNKKLVNLCMDSVHQPGVKNRYFIATNATTTFRSIVSSYSGDLVLVLIQCPNPDFNKPGHRWRMVQRSLVEAISDLLSTNGKVFLQSDVETVAVRMREEFLKYGKHKLVVVKNENGECWHEDNPYGVRSDWERHVIDHGAPMYRLMFSKVDHPCGSS